MATETSIFEDDVFKPAARLDQTVLPPLAETMNITLVANAESQLWLIHDKHFIDLIMWAEYDIDDSAVSLILRDGRIQPLGLPIYPPARKVMRQSRQLFTMLMQDQKIIDSYILPLLVRETGYYRA